MFLNVAVAFACAQVKMKGVSHTDRVTPELQSSFFVTV